METIVKVSTNWNLIGGTDISKVIQTKVTHEDVFIKSKLDEIISEDRAILLCGTGGDVACATTQDPCEFNIRVFPRYKIESLTLVCTVSKIELFVGAQKEYMETVYGTTIEDDEEDESDRSYRFDIEIVRSGVVEIMIKLLPSSNEICIYVIQLNIAPNPNGVTTLLPNAIDLDNVQEMLESSNQKLSPNAEKCKIFLQKYKNIQMHSTSPSPSSSTAALMMEQIKQMMELNISERAATNETIENEQNNTTTALRTEGQLKNYIETRFEKLEAKVITRLDEMEKSQNMKLDNIIKFLENKTGFI